MLVALVISHLLMLVALALLDYHALAYLAALTKKTVE
jgi:hypothetical protein